MDTITEQTGHLHLVVEKSRMQDAVQQDLHQHEDTWIVLLVVVHLGLAREDNGVHQERPAHLGQVLLIGTEVHLKAALVCEHEHVHAGDQE